MTGDPASENAEHSYQAVDCHDVNPALFDIQAPSGVKKIRKPNEEEPPNGIGQEFGDDERPGLPIAKQLKPSDFLLRYLLVAVAPDVRQFSLAKPVRPLRHLVKRNPQEEPKDTRGARRDESGLPAKAKCHPWNNRRSDQR